MNVIQNKDIINKGIINISIDSTEEEKDTLLKIIYLKNEIFLMLNKSCSLFGLKRNTTLNNIRITQEETRKQIQREEDKEAIIIYLKDNSDKFIFVNDIAEYLGIDNETASELLHELNIDLSIKY